MLLYIGHYIAMANNCSSNFKSFGFVSEGQPSKRLHDENTRSSALVFNESIYETNIQTFLRRALPLMSNALGSKRV